MTIRQNQLDQITLQVTDLPPTFDGSHPAYALALFSLMLISAVSGHVIVRTWRAWRATDARGLNAPATAFRLVIATLMLAIIFLALPDVAVLLVWGEVSSDVMGTLMMLDRSFDGLTMLPFLAAILTLARTEDQLVYQLVRRPPPAVLWSTWPAVRHQLAFIGLVAFLAIGVTLGK